MHVVAESSKVREDDDMSMMMGIISSSNRKRMDIKDQSGKVVGSVTVRRGSTQPVKKKRLPYSFKEISTRLLKTKKSGNAHQVLISARQKVVSLRLMYKGGVYDDDEVFAALMHAQAIVRVAKKREKHLKEEERAEKKGGFCEADLQEKTDEATDKQMHAKEREETKAERDMQRMQKMMEECERMMREAMKELEQLENLDEFSEEMGLDGEVSMDPKDLEMMKKKHRADELREIMEADMKYLKFIFDRLEKERQSNNSGGGSYAMGVTDNSGGGSVALELGGVDIPVEAAPDAMTIVEGGAVDAMA